MLCCDYLSIVKIRPRLFSLRVARPRSNLLLFSPRGPQGTVTVSRESLEELGYPNKKKHKEREEPKMREVAKIKGLRPL